MTWKHVLSRGVAFASVLTLAAMPVLAQPGGFGQRHRPSPEERIDWRMGFLTEKLSLSADQSKSVRAILEKAQEDAAAWHKDHGDTSRDDWRAYRDEHRTAVDSAITKVLSKDQQATYKELKDQRGTGGPGMRDGGRGMMRHQMGFRGGPMGPGMWSRDGCGMGSRMGYGMEPRMGDGMGPGFADGMGPGSWGRGHFEGRRQAMGFGAGLFGGRMMHRLAEKLDLSEEQMGRIAAVRSDRREKMNAWNEAHPDATWQDRLAFRQDQFDSSTAAIGKILTPEQNKKLDKLAARLASHNERNQDD
jgi:Spy/CpxP family protein refolding chaperone